MRDGKTPMPAGTPPVTEGESLALIEADSVPAGRKKNFSSVLPAGGAVCCDCRHPFCKTCEKGSAARQYSDFWICHRCGELNRRTALDAVDVPDAFGKD